MKVHNLGSLILTVLEDLEDNPGEAIKTASEIFQTKGQVYPVTEKSVDLVIMLKFILKQRK